MAQGQFPNVEPPRIGWLDAQRGMLALGILAYHLAQWHGAQLDSGRVLGRLGIYGVSMFFVLSGLSMALVYHGFMRDRTAAGRFYVRRLFRILPMLWLAVALAPAGASTFVIWLNVTGLFGFLDPGEAINAGAWSIGNELVYYALTPMVLAAYGRRKALGNAIVATSAVVALLFAFIWIDRSKLLAQQWLTYINPFDNLFLYLAGIAIYFNVGAVPRTALVLIGVACLAVFIGWPSSGDLASIVTGFPRIAYCAASIGLVIFFYRLGSLVHREPPRALMVLGMATYGVYLLHPIVWERLQPFLHGPALWLATIGVTVAAAIVSYAWLESPLIRLGKRLTTTVRVTLVQT